MAHVDKLMAGITPCKWPQAVFDSLDGEMSWRQLSIRTLAMLVINHVQFIISILVCARTIMIVCCPATPCRRSSAAACCRLPPSWL